MRGSQAPHTDAYPDAPQWPYRRAHEPYRDLCRHVRSLVLTTCDYSSAKPLISSAKLASM